MAHKRALIVDDSRSARLFLARILEKHEIDVDSVDSAEAAIGYLASRRPDVIFMDHQMPGMDGFQAVQAIKNDSRTATIPIMMYTSQEGEVFLGQARALGAVGVLPKQIKHADVSKVLYQLHLIADRRTDEQTTFKPLEAIMPHAAREGAGKRCRRRRESGSRIAGFAAGTARAGCMPASRRRPTRSQPRSARCPHGRVRAHPAGLPCRQSWSARWRSSLPVSGGAITPECRRTALSWHCCGSRSLRHPASAPAARPAPACASALAAPGASPAAAPPPLVLEVPYGADALGGARLGVIKRLLDRMVADNVSGVVQIRTFAGRFCLKGDPVNGYTRWLPARLRLPSATSSATPPTTPCRRRSACPWLSPISSAGSAARPMALWTLRPP